MRMRAVILAAGYATRLYPLTLNIPKPLLKITPDKAVIDFIVDDLVKCGAIDEIAVVTNHKFAGAFSAWARRRHDRVPIVILDDGTHSNEDRLGAVGDLKFVVDRRRIDGDCVVIGGDNLFDRGLDRFLRFARSKAPFASLGLFDIGDRASARRFGVVTTQANGRVLSFEEKPERPKSTCVATCLYFFPAQTLAALDIYMADPRTSKDAPGNYIRWLMEKKGVYGFALRTGHWVDIGAFATYKDAVARYNGAA